MTDNIIHCVLARLPDAPSGTRGISLFLVPKRLVDEAGEVGELNGCNFALPEQPQKQGNNDVYEVDAYDCYFGCIEKHAKVPMYNDQQTYSANQLPPQKNPAKCILP